MSSVICEECKRCWNYMVCENGCYGSTEPCEHYTVYLKCENCPIKDKCELKGENK